VPSGLTATCCALVAEYKWIFFSMLGIFSCVSLLGIYAAVQYVLSSFTATCSLLVAEYKWTFSRMLWIFPVCRYWASIQYVLSSLTATCCLLDA